MRYAARSSSDPTVMNPLARPRRRRLCAGLLALALPAGALRAQAVPTLHARLNALRAAHGLPPVPPSRVLDAVAAAHVRDLEARPPAGECSLHSWSTDGAWSSCCYRGDRDSARCMWDKPHEFSRGAYKADGFEIAAWTSGTMTADEAIAIWRGSDAHLDVLLNRGRWARRAWAAMGAAIQGRHAVAWFGTQPDP